MDEKRERVVDTMSGADALLWTIGRNPVLRPTVIAVMVLDKSPDWTTIQARVATLTEIVPRLRSHAVVRKMGNSILPSASGAWRFLVEPHSGMCSTSPRSGALQVSTRFSRSGKWSQPTVSTESGLH